MLNLYDFITFVSLNIKTILFLNLAIILVLIIVNLKYLKYLIRGIKRKTWVLVLVIFVFSFTIRIVPGIIYQSSNEPEWYYKKIAKLMTTDSYIDLHGKRIHPVGYPYLLNGVFKIGQANDSSVFIFNSIIGSLTTIAIFLVAFLLFNNSRIALLSSLIFSALFKNIYYSRTGASEPISVLFITLTMFFFLASYRTNKLSMYLLASSFLAYSAEIKSESIVYIVVFIIGLKLFNREFIKLLVPIIFLAVIILPVYTFYFNHLDLPLMVEKIISPEFAKDNGMSSFYNNIFGFVNEIRLSKLYEKAIFIFAALSFVYWLRYKKEIIFLGMFLIINLLLYSSTLYSVAERYIVMIYPTISILSSLGITAVIKINKSRVYSNIVAGIIITTLVAGSVFALSNERYHNDVYEIVQMRDSFLNSDATIICCNWMEHCGFLMPKAMNLEDFIQSYPLIKHNISREEFYYIMSPNEKKVGCSNSYRNMLIEKFELKLIKNNPITEVYKISAK